MNKIYFCFFLSVVECLHNYATVMIVFFMFKLVFVPSKAFGMIWVKVDLILLKNKNFCAHENNSQFEPESDKIPNPFAVDQYTNFSGRPNFSEFLEFQKYSK